MLRSSGAAGIATLLSRILGFVREWAMARFMGTSPVADAFIMAFTLPNLFRRLLGEGVLSVAFVPIFKAKEQTQTPSELWRAVNAVLCALITICLALIVLTAVGSTLLMFAVDLPIETDLMLRLVRIMFPYLLFVCIAAVFIGVLNARGHFFLPAMGTVVLNVVLIGSIFFLAPQFGTELSTQVFGLAIGVLVAGIAQAVFQLPGLWKEGYRPVWVNPLEDSTVREVAARMAPATIGAAAFQLNVVITQWMAASHGKSIVSSFNYAVRLMELPQGVFGISLATYLLTELSHLSAQKKYPEFRATLREGILNVVFLNALATGVLCVLAEPIVRLLFEYRVFDADSTDRTSLALQCLAPGLILFSLNNILTRAFFALGDVKTPMRISIFCLSVNILLAMALLPQLKQGGLGLANSMSACINSALLLYALRRKLPSFEFASMRAPLLAILGVAVLAGLCAWGSHFIWERRLGHQGIPLRAGAVFVPILLSTGVYFLVALWMRLPQAKDVVGALQNRLRKPKPPESV